MSETRKIAAILVANVVGYSRLAGADEHQAFVWLRLANECFETSSEVCRWPAWDEEVL